MVNISVCVLQNGSVYTGNTADTSSVKFNLQQCLAANARRLSTPAATSAVIQLPVHSQEVASLSAARNPVTKLTDQRGSAEASGLGVNSRQVRSGQNRQSKPPLPPAKDRRRTTAWSSTALSPKKTSTLTSEVDCCELTAAGVQATAARRQQQQKQHHRKKTETPSFCGVDYTRPLVGPANGTPATQLAFQPPRCGLHPAATTTSPASAPVFTAVPAAGVLLRGAVPVGARRCGATCPVGALQPVDGRLARHHQHVLVAEQRPPAPCGRLYHPGPSTTGPRATGAGWGYAAGAPSVARPQPAVCREYLLFGPSSVLLLR